MLWFRLLGAVGVAPPPGEERIRRAEDARASALLEQHRRALDILNRELELYQHHHQGEARQ